MSLNRREFLIQAALAASSLLPGLASPGLVSAAGRVDPDAVLKEVFTGAHGVALLADLEARVLVGPTDTSQAFRMAWSTHSSIKPFSYWAGLQQGIIQPDTPYFCDGSRCHFGGHGRINAFEAVWRSCNGFFLELGPRLDRPRFLELLKTLGGYGRVTGLGGEEEAPGRILEAIDTPEDAAQLAAHGVGIEVTPVQQLLIAMRFAVQGRSFPLSGRVIDAWPAAEAARLELVRRSWRLHALKGAGRRADRKRYPLGSRTGTSKGSGWYLAFGPFEKPRYVLAIHLAPPPSEPGYPLQEAVRLGGAVFRGLG